MADISTAVSMARVPILGENGRISDDYIPAAIGEGVESAEAAAKRAETAATNAAGSATAAGTSAAGAQGSASAASASAAQAQQSATAASGAVTQAQSAQQAAEAAKTGAESARGSAQTAASQAQQSATAAAESAESVADKFITSAQATTLEPGSQATASVVDQVLTIGVPRGEKGEKGDVGEKGDPGTGVPEGGEPGQLLSKTADGTAWVDPPSGNVLTGEAEGYVAHAEDAYAQKPIETRIKGKTWVNRWPVLSGTHNGITVATDGTGLVTVTGIATADADVTADVSGWATGKSYTTTISATPTGCSAYFEVQKPSGNTSINATTTGATLNVASDATNCVAGVHVTSGTTVNASFRVMLVDGTEAPDCFTPCASITSVQTGKLVTSGKNLVNTSDASVLEGTFGVRLPNVTLQPGTYVIKRPSGFTGNFAIYREGDTSTIVSAISEAGTSFTLTSPIHGLDFRSSDAGQITLDNISQFQLELGSTATPYEPPTVTTTPLPEVELRSLPNGTCDELVIRADGSCEVERVLKRFDSETSGWYGYAVSNELAYIILEVNTDLVGDWSDVVSELPVVKALVSDDTLVAPHWANNSKALFFRFPATEASDLNSAIEYMASIGAYCYAQVRMSTEPQSPVTLPALPAPTFNQYHDADIPSDTTVTYERDLNIVIDNLAKQIAGTAATVAINEATR